MGVSLMPHQVRVLDQTAGLDRVAYYLDMGLGKTYVGAEKALAIGASRTLVICQKSKVRDWCEHFAMHADGRADVLDLTARGAVERFVEPGGSKLVGVINYELAWRRERLRSLRDFTLILDESSLIQNPKAKQTKFVLRLQPSAAILLSGTPTSGKYENLWTQAHLLGWDISERAYQAQYVNWRTLWIGGTPIRQVDKREPYKNVERLKRKLREHGAVFMKTEDVLDMPAQTFAPVTVPASREYREFMREAIVDVGGDTLVGDTALTKRLRARQLCGAYSAEKLAAFCDLVASTNDRLVVFYNFAAELDALRACIGERPVSIVSGPVKDLAAYESEPDSIAFVQYQAGAMGLNLQKANKAVYFTLPERSELFEQSKKRIHRIGQARPCVYWVMMCEGTIDGQIYEALKMRRDYTDELFKEADNGRLATF